MHKTFRALAATATVAACAATAAPASAGPQDITDAQFLGAAAQSNRFEIVTGQLAARRGDSRAVRRLGRQFARHHSTQLELGSAVAAKLGVSVPPGLAPARARDVQRLQRRRGHAFDRLWLTVQRAAHREAIALHLRGALTGDTTDVRTLAITGLPVIGQHFGELQATRGGHRGH